MSRARRQGNNPKRKVISPENINEALLAQLREKAKYVGSPHHKCRPADYDMPAGDPRPIKSVCDFKRKFPLERAIDLMKAGIKAGMFSQPDATGMPKYIWAVATDDEVFECKTHPNTPWEYHGYPISGNEKGFPDYILDEWKKRDA